MLIRLANMRDAAALAKVHIKCTSQMSRSFMDKLGINFLTFYYKILLGEKKSVVVCAENEYGQIVGFHSGSLDTQEHFTMLEKNKVMLLVSALPAILRDPRLLSGMYKRRASRSAQHDVFVSMEGPRAEFWAWINNEGPPGGAVAVLKKWISIMRLLGAKGIRFEVDEDNTHALDLHRAIGAVLVREYVTPDGQVRFLMEYPDIKPRNIKPSK